VQRNPCSLKFASRACQNDPEIVRAAVHQGGRSLQFASMAARDDRDVVLAAVCQNGDALEFASSACQNDRAIVLAAVCQNGFGLRHADAECRNNLEIVTEAMRKDPGCMRYAGGACHQKLHTILGRRFLVDWADHHQISDSWQTGQISPLNPHCDVTPLPIESPLRTAAIWLIEFLRWKLKREMQEVDEQDYCLSIPLRVYMMRMMRNRQFWQVVMRRNVPTCSLMWTATDMFLVAQQDPMPESYLLGFCDAVEDSFERADPNVRRSDLSIGFSHQRRRQPKRQRKHHRHVQRRQQRKQQQQQQQQQMATSQLTTRSRQFGGSNKKLRNSVSRAWRRQFVDEELQD